MDGHQENRNACIPGGSKGRFRRGSRRTARSGQVGGVLDLQTRRDGGNTRITFWLT